MKTFRKSDSVRERNGHRAMIAGGGARSPFEANPELLEPSDRRYRRVVARRRGGVDTAASPLNHDHPNVRLIVDGRVLEFVGWPSS